MTSKKQMGILLNFTSLLGYVGLIGLMEHYSPNVMGLMKSLFRSESNYVSFRILVITG